jgi:hypothetical protein
MSSTAHFAGHQFVLVWLENLGRAPDAEHAASRTSSPDLDLAFGQFVIDVLVDDRVIAARGRSDGAAVTLGMLLVKHSTCSL